MQLATSLPPPLTVAPDMPSRWDDVDLGFDAAADRLIRAHQADGVATDLPILDLRTWGVVPCDGRFAVAPLGGHHQPKELRSAGLSNLLGRLGAPVEFVRDRLPAPLQLATTNYLLASGNNAIGATLRLRDDEVTAVVSGRYAPLDAEELIDSIRSALVRHCALDSVRVRSLATGLVDVVRLTFPAEQEALRVGDVTALGLDFSTSSFGRSAVHVRGLLWRLVCTNGLRAAERHGGFSFRHVGDSQRLKAGIEEAIPSCLTIARGLMDRWRAAVTTMVSNVEALISNMRELSVSEKKNVHDELLLESGAPAVPDQIDAYSLVNAITGAARKAEPGRRLALESLAGQVLHRHVEAT